MYNSKLKIIIFLLGFIFALASFSGAVSAAICNINPEANFQAVTYDNSINYTDILQNSPIHSKNFIQNNISATYNAASKPKDQQLFKNQLQGYKNLQTLSSGGIPRKGLDEMLADNIERFQPMIKKTKTKIKHIISTFHKKLK